MKRIKWDTLLKIKNLTTLIALATIPQYLFASTAKVTFLKGSANALVNGKSVPLKMGSAITENTEVETQDKSVIKVKLPDNSQLTVGPKSKIVIEKFRNKNDPSLVSVASGLLRSSVPHEDNENTKMLIKTKSAVMGVRGTELQTIYNPKNNVASTITFTGNVAMAKLPPNANPSSMLASLNKDAVSIKAGQVSITNMSKGFSITPPTKMSPVQFNSLKRNDTFTESKEKSADNNKKVVPPGLSVKKAAPEPPKLEQTLGVQETPKNDIPAVANIPAANDGPAAGGYVDLNTGLYVPPPEGSTFDPNTGVYVPNESVGKVDPETGAFLTTEGTTLSDDGEFKDSKTGETKADIPSVSKGLNEGEGPQEFASNTPSGPQDPGPKPIPNPVPPGGPLPLLPSILDTSPTKDALSSVVKTHANVTIKINLK